MLLKSIRITNEEIVDAMNIYQFVPGSSNGKGVPLKKMLSWVFLLLASSWSLISLRSLCASSPPCSCLERIRRCCLNHDGVLDRVLFSEIASAKRAVLSGVLFPLSFGIEEPKIGVGTVESSLSSLSESGHSLASSSSCSS